MDLELKGKTALILGAGGGLGGAIAATLAREGAAVIVADISGEAAKAVADQIVDAGGAALTLQWDIGDLAAADVCMRTIETEFGGVDILVALSGGPPPGGATGWPAEKWRSHFNDMVLSIIAIADRVLPGMRARKWGRIIVSTSSGVVAPIPGLGLSNALRSTLVGWSKTLAAEVGADGITANIVVPGRISTKRIAFLDAKKAEREHRSLDSVVAESTATIPLGRYGDPQEYADVVAFLAGGPASYVTGSVIRVDGGYIPSI